MKFANLARSYNGHEFVAKWFTVIVGCTSGHCRKAYDGGFGWKRKRKRIGGGVDHVCERCHCEKALGGLRRAGLRNSESEIDNTS